MSTPTSSIGIIDQALAVAIYSQFTALLDNQTQANTVIFYPNEVAQREWSEKQGKSVVDFISYFRIGTQFSWARNRSTTGTMGVPLNYTDSNMDSQIYVKAIPLDLDYEIAFWHHDLDVLNALIQAYFFWIFTNPTITVEISNYPTSIYLNMTGAPAMDMSTVRNMYSVGKYWVYHGSIKTEAWTPNIPNLTGSTIQQIICNVWLLQNGTGSSSQNINLGNFTLP